MWLNRLLIVVNDVTDNIDTKETAATEEPLTSITTVLTFNHE